ncbi:glucokinase [Thermanaeromonas toyohensis ToBE]|uniref:Glucokinase n=2 Tax=Thermanaeromonas TaxID=202949 RepID=A0A1W1W1Z5_9FIRM|nr:glucokinase [Thermanaeromonas toyohensis ToBE]
MRVIGIDVGGSKIRGALVSRDGSLQRVIEISTEADKGGLHVVRRVLSIIKELLEQSVLGIGIGTAGQVGFDGSILGATNTFPGWTGIPLKKIVESETYLPVKVVNDVHAMALGELYFGEAKGVQHFLCLALGTGVGGAIVINRKLFRGSTGAAGEIGHLIIHPNGRSCPCGRKGCLEAYVSATALTKRYEEKTGIKMKASEILKNSLLGKELEAEIIKDFLEDLANALASLVSIFDPQKIILGGGIAKELLPYLKKLMDMVKYQLNPTRQPTFRLSISQLGGDAMILGAASLFLKEGELYNEEME